MNIYKLVTFFIVLFYSKFTPHGKKKPALYTIPCAMFIFFRRFEKNTLYLDFFGLSLYVIHSEKNHVVQS